MASSSASLSLCSTFSSHCNVNSHRSSPTFASLSKPSLNLTKPVIRFLSPSTTTSSSRVTFPIAPKFAESAVAEPETTDIEAVVVSDVAEVTEDKPKREEIFAVVMVGGRQYIVFPGRYLYTSRLKDANVDDKIVLNKVLLVGTKTHTYIGKPVVNNATVHAVVESQGLDDKVVVFKYKPKKKYRRNIGHRQPNTRIRITGITGYEEYPASPNVAV